MKSFSDILQSLDSIDNIQQLTLRNENGEVAAEIINKAGSQGSLKVYNHLYKIFGSISVEAAAEGIKLFAEHTQDSIDNPGKHPNIDRLLKIVETKQPLNVEIFKN